MKKKLPVILALLLCFSLLCTACGKSDTTEPTTGADVEKTESGDQQADETEPDSTTPAVDDGEPKTVVIGCGFDVMGLDPGHAYEYYCNMVMYALYDNLVQIQPGSDEPVPCLAESYQIADDNVTYTFQLRDDVIFATGNKMTSHDVKWCIERTHFLKTTTSMHTDGIESMECPDDTTLVIKLSAPDSSFLTKLAVNTFAVMDSKVLAENGGLNTEDAATKDTAEAYINEHKNLGSGPFLVESFNPGVELVLKRNENYWGTKPEADRVIIKAVTDSNAALMMLDTGDLDVSLNITADQLPQIDSSSNVKYEMVPTATITYLLMNQNAEFGGPMTNPDVRRAVGYALDYSKIQSLAGEGSFTPWSMVQSTFVGYKGNRPVDYTNIEKAKELLAQAGYPDGFEVTLEVGDYEAGGVKLSDLAQLIANDLSQVGINVKLEILTSAIAVERYVAGKQGFALWLWTPDYYDLNNQLAFSPGGKCGALASWNVDTPEDQELYSLCQDIISELDADARAEKSLIFQETLADGSPFWCLCQHPRIVAYGANMSGVNSSDVYHIYLPTLSK